MAGREWGSWPPRLWVRGSGWTGRPWAGGFQQRLLRTKGSESFPTPGALRPASCLCSHCLQFAPEMSRPMAGPLSARVGRAVSDRWAHRHLLSTCCVPGSILRGSVGKGADELSNADPDCTGLLTGTGTVGCPQREGPGLLW